MYELYVLYKDYCRHQNSYEQCKQFTVYKKMYTVYCRQSLVHSTPYFVDCIQYTVCTVKHSYSPHTFLLCVSYTQYDILYNLDCGLLTVNGIQYTFRPFTVYVLCTVYCLHKKSLNTPRYYSDVRIFGILRQMEKNAIMANF